MSVEPPSSGRPTQPPSGRPTGPPSGPLSGPSPPPSGPPSQPPGSGGGATPAPEPRRPWWKSASRVAVLTTAVVAAVVLAVVLTRSDNGGSGKSGEVFLQAAGKTGPDPFTPSTAKDSSTATVSASPTTPESTPANAVRGVEGGAAGLYGGSRNVSSCDVEKQIRYLQTVPEKSRAFASVEGIQPSEVPAYLRGLTPVQLRMDTRVTNHGYRDGTATGYQAVLQAGTAVLVDGHGVPRTRCACGNPLTPPVALQSTPTPTGDSWPSYRSSNVVVVTPAPQIINVFVIYDPDHDQWISRHRGDTGHKDRPAKPPVHPSPSVSVTTPTAPSSSKSPSPCASTGTTTPCPSTSTSTSPSSSSSGPTAPSSSSKPPAKPDSSPGTSPPEPPPADSTTVSAPVSSATTPPA